MWKIAIKSDIESFVYVFSELKGIALPRENMYLDVEEGDLSVTLVSTSEKKLLFETNCVVKSNADYNYPQIVVKDNQFVDCSVASSKEEIQNGFVDECGVIYSKNGKQLLCGKDINTESYHLKEGCMVIRPYAFVDGSQINGDVYINECKILRNIILPNSIRYIGQSAFSGCVNLEEVANLQRITDIEPYTFEGCNLQTLQLPDGLYRIGEGAFAGCKKLSSVVFPSSLKVIEPCAFDGCSSLQEIRIPKETIRVGNNAFCDCSRLKRISFLGDCVQIESNVFIGCDSLETMVFLGDVVRFNNDAFNQLSGLKVYIPKGNVDLYSKISMVFGYRLLPVELPEDKLFELTL